jgi:hypothetical protein
MTPAPLPPVPQAGAGAAIPLPASRPQASKPIEPTKQPQPASRTQARKRGSVGLMAFLLVLVAVAGGVYVFKDKIFGGDEGARVERPKTATAPTTNANVTPVAPTPPPPPSAQLRAEGGSIDVPAARDATVAWTVENAAKVSSGDVVAKLDGAPKAEADLDRAQKSLTNYSERLAFYTEKQNPAKIAEKTQLVEEAKVKVAAAEQALAAAVVKAPVAGEVQLLAGKGAQVKAGDPVIRIGGDPQLVATFEVPRGGDYEAGKGCTVAAKAAREKEFSCVIDTVDATAGSVSVRLVAVPGSPAAAGDEVILLPARK